MKFRHLIERNRFPDALFVMMTFQLSILSLSIAAASMSFSLAALIVLVWWIADRRSIIPRTPLDYLVLAYVVIELVTACTAIYPGQAFYYSKRLLLIANLYFIIVAVDSPRKVLVLLLALIGSTAILSLVEIAYYYAAHESRLFMFQHYMTTGGIKMIVALLCIPLLIHPDTPRKVRAWTAALFLPTLVALVLTNTRSAWLGFIAGAVLIALTKQKKLIVLLALFIVAFFLFAPQKNIERARSIVDPTHPSNTGRLTMWATGWKIFLDHPVLGVGDSDLLAIYSQYRTPEENEPAGHLHNNYLMILVTLGIGGFVIVMGLFGKIIAVLYKAQRQLSKEWLLGSAALASFALFCGFLVNGFFEWNFGSHQIMVLVWSSIGLTFAVLRLGESEGVAT
jgi:O-antigen ligase